MALFLYIGVAVLAVAAGLLWWRLSRLARRQRKNDIYTLW